MELTEKEKAKIMKRRQEMEKEYPYLKEAGMKEMLEKALVLEILIDREQKELSQGEGNVKTYDILLRTYTLLLTRMGITFVSRKREKRRERPKTPMELLEEDEDE